MKIREKTKTNDPEGVKPDEKKEDEKERAKERAVTELCDKQTGV